MFRKPNGMVVKPNLSTPPKSIERTLCPQESNGEDHEVGQQDMERRNYTSKLPFSSRRTSSTVKGSAPAIRSLRRMF